MSLTHILELLLHRNSWNESYWKVVLKGHPKVGSISLQLIYIVLLAYCRCFINIKWLWATGHILNNLKMFTKWSCLLISSKQKRSLCNSIIFQYSLKGELDFCSLIHFLQCNFGEKSQVAWKELHEGPPRSVGGALCIPFFFPFSFCKDISNLHQMMSSAFVIIKRIFVHLLLGSCKYIAVS